MFSKSWEKCVVFCTIKDSKGVLRGGLLFACSVSGVQDAVVERFDGSCCTLRVCALRKRLSLSSHRLR